MNSKSNPNPFPWGIGWREFFLGCSLGDRKKFEHTMVGSLEADNDEVQMVARALAIGDRARHIVLDEDDEEEKKMAMPLGRSTRL